MNSVVLRLLSVFCFMFGVFGAIINLKNETAYNSKIPFLTHDRFPINRELDHSENLTNLELPKLTHDSTFNLDVALYHDKLRKEIEDDSINSRSDYDADRPIRHRIEATLHELKYCKHPAKCINLTYNSCMGTKLPYTSTTLDLTDLTTQEQVQEKLWLYEHLRHVPKCWAVIQPFLCSLYMPKCERNFVDLPSMDMCNITRGPCKVLYGTQFFPALLRCENDKRMPLPRECKNDLREIKFNTTGQCVTPLIQTDSLPSFYKGIDGCGLQCRNPLYTEEEHAKIHQLVAWGASVCLIVNMFTIFTFFIDWKTANRYPGVEIFYINICFLITCIGWLAQFIGNFRDDIICRKDNTLRMAEPSADENLWCVIVFILIYYFLIAALVWFVIFTYTWYLSVTVQAFGKIPERIDRKGAYFHLASWSFPLVLTITTMALGEIDADSVSGICFVGYISTFPRAILLLLPVCVALAVAYYFLFRGLLTLIRLQLGSRDVISPRASHEIRSTIIRIGIIYGTTIFLGLITLTNHIYQFSNSDLWKSSLHELIICRITHASLINICELNSRPNFRWLKFQIFAVFIAGISMSSLTWTRPTLKTWVRFIRRKFDCEKEEPIRLQKHKVIAKAFAKRKMFYNAGRLSLSFHNTHTDPVGLNFDLNSAASHDLSSTWAAALPKLMNRRCALTGAPAGSVSSQRRNSMDSEVSFSVRRVSVESRRNSVDSQVSVQVAELKATRKVVGTTAKRSRGKRRHRRPSRTVVGQLFSRRESSTSLESQLGAHLLSALVHPDVQTLVPNLKRRSANAGLDTEQITNLLSSGKLLLPLATAPSGSEVDEELKSEIPVDGQNEVSDWSQTSECAELTRLAVQSSLNSGISVGTQHNGCKSVDVAVQADARDIAIQTLSSYELEINELNKSFDELQSGRRSKSQCVSQGTQMSPIVSRRSEFNDCVYKKSDENSPVYNNKSAKNFDECESELCLNKRYNKNSIEYDDKEEKESLITDLSNIKIVSSVR